MGKMTNVDLTKVSEALMNPPSTTQPKPKLGRFNRHQGGPINAGGVYTLLPNEMVLDNQAVAALAQALTMVTMSQENAMAGGGNTTIISAPTQPITNLAQNSTNINQINVPESAVNNERTFRTVAHGQMARA